MTLVYNIQTTGSSGSRCTAPARFGTGPVANVVFDVIGPIGSRSPINITRADQRGLDRERSRRWAVPGLRNARSRRRRRERMRGDCNDANPAVRPGAAEACNNVDDDCDGIVDDVPWPAGSPTLQVGRLGGAAWLSWTAVSGASAYDAVRGRLEALHAEYGAFAVATDTCLLNESPQRSVSDASTPPPGDGFWYLVRPSAAGEPVPTKRAPTLRSACATRASRVLLIAVPERGRTPANTLLHRDRSACPLPERPARGGRSFRNFGTGKRDRTR